VGQASPASAICSGVIVGHSTQRAASSARAEASQCLITSGAAAFSGSSSTSRLAALTRVSIVLALLTVV
jgi:hypothetical protein